MCRGNEESCKIWRGIALSFQSWQIYTQALDNLKNLHFNGLLLTKVYVWIKKKYSGVIFDRTEDWCKI